MLPTRGLSPCSPMRTFWKKKFFLEIEEIESQRNARERKDKLEDELTRAKIDELKARKEFFETLTEGIKKKFQLHF